MRLFCWLGRRYLAAVLLCWLLLWGLLLATSWMEGAGYLARAPGGAGLALWLALLSTAPMAWQLLPVALVLGLAAWGAQLGQRGELTGLFALGVPPWRVALPAFCGAGLYACLGVCLAQQLLPPLADHSIRLRAAHLGRADAEAQKNAGLQHWFRGEGFLLYLPRLAEDQRDSYAQPWLLQLADDGRRPRALWRAEALARAADGHGFVLQGARCQRWQGDCAPPVGLGRLPANLGDTHGHYKTLGAAKLSALVARREAAGVDSRGHRRERVARFVVPALGWMAVLFAVPWVLRPGRAPSLLALLGQAAAFVAALLLGQALMGFCVPAPALGQAVLPALLLTLSPLSARLAWRYTICSGRTVASNSSAVTKPFSSATCLSVLFSLWAVLATCAALS